MMHFLSNDSVTVSGDETDGVKGVQQCRQSIRVDNHPEARLPYNIHNRSPTTESLAHTATRKRPILNVASQSRLIPYLRHPESPYPFKPLTERIDAINRVIAAADCIETPNCPKICTFRISDFCPTFEDLHISQPDIRVSDYVWNPKSHVVCSGNSNAAGGHSGSSPAQTQQISSGSNNEESSRRRKGKEREKEGDGDGSGGDGDSRTGPDTLICKICGYRTSHLYNFKRHLNAHFKHKPSQFQQDIMGCNRQQLELLLSNNHGEVRAIIRRNRAMIESITSNPSSSYNGSVSPQPHALGSNQAIGHTIAQQLNRAYSTGTDQGQLLHGFLSGLSDSVAQHLDKVNQELQRKRDANDLSETPEAHNLVPPQKRIKSFDSGISACGHAGAQETGRSEQNQQSTPSVSTSSSPSRTTSVTTIPLPATTDRQQRYSTNAHSSSIDTHATNSAETIDGSTAPLLPQSNISRDAQWDLECPYGPHSTAQPSCEFCEPSMELEDDYLFHLVQSGTK